ncbi:HNH endonuclease [Aedoeadaptatus coxii]|uniref:HNH endonuclease n=1 Tax=Aedoeadaptatus coxii TaxID=755172 RepID=UPI002AD56FDB|nr:HNH endonuclease [Peptoniphilus coxii]
MKCIYCGEETSDVKSKEHVIPAFLGGKRKLPAGYVCDHCNQVTFSKIENNVARYSMIRIFRSFQGPGKRGSISPSKAYVDQWSSALDDDGNIQPVYVSNAKPYAVPALKIQLRENDDFSMEGLYFREDLDIEEFIEKLKNINSESIKIQQNDELINENQILVIYDVPSHYRNHKNQIKKFEDKYFIVLKHSKIDNNKVENVLNNIKSKDIYVDRVEKRSSKMVVNYKIDHNINHFNRVILKIMLNTLAYFEGKEFINNPNFDQAKSFVLTGEGDSSCQFLDPGNLTTTMDCLLETNVNTSYSIYCKIPERDVIISIVCLYGNFKYMKMFDINLIGTKELKFGFDGLVVDIKNSQENTANDLIYKRLCEMFDNEDL